MIRLLFSSVLVIVLVGCVAATPPKPELVRVSGAIAFKEASLLPGGSEATVAIVDADKPGVVLTRRTYPVAKLPAPFFFSIPKEQVDERANYMVWATVKVNGLPILQTFDRYPVINNERYNVNVLLKGIE